MIDPGPTCSESSVIIQCFNRHFDRREKRPTNLKHVKKSLLVETLFMNNLKRLRYHGLVIKMKTKLLVYVRYNAIKWHKPLRHHTSMTTV